MTKIGFGLVAAAMLAGAAAAQTEGTATFTFKTAVSDGKFEPKNLVAVWVVDAQGKYVRTLVRMAEKRAKWLKAWNEASGGDAKDAVTGPTRRDHAPVTATWDGRDAAGKPAPDGEYVLRVETTSANAAGPCTGDRVKFVKGPAPVNAKIPDWDGFSGMEIRWMPAGRAK